MQSGTFHPGEPPKMAVASLLSELLQSLAIVAKSKDYVYVLFFWAIVVS